MLIVGGWKCALQSSFQQCAENGGEDRTGLYAKYLQIDTGQKGFDVAIGGHEG